MTIGRRAMLASIIGGLAATGVKGQSSETAQAVLPPPEDVELWPEESLKLPTVETRPDPSVPNLVPKAQLPVMTVYRPANPTGTALLLCAGGGYLIVGRGPGLGTWFAKRGITVFDLRYRLPGVGFDAGPDAPLQDAQRAMRLIRRDANRFGIDPAKVGVAGFSSGGHVAAMLTTAYDDETRAIPVNDLSGSARPDFGVLGCPVITMTKPLAHGSSFRQLFPEAPTPALIARYSPEQRVTPETPPVLIGHASDDRVVPLENSLLLLAALRKARVSAEMHAFQSGGHNFGAAFTAGNPLSAFPALMLDWMTRNTWLEGANT